MSNRDIEAAHEYHTATKHSYWSVRLGSHFLDWEHKPLPFKVYPHACHPASASYCAARRRGFRHHFSLPAVGASVLDLAWLAQVLFFYAGL